MAEWLKAHAWKACIPQGIQGSNPCLSAILPFQGHPLSIKQYDQAKRMLAFCGLYSPRKVCVDTLMSLIMT